MERQPLPTTTTIPPPNNHHHSTSKQPPPFHLATTTTTPPPNNHHHSTSHNHHHSTSHNHHHSTSQQPPPLHLPQPPPLHLPTTTTTPPPTTTTTPPPTTTTTPPPNNHHQPTSQSPWLFKFSFRSCGLFFTLLFIASSDHFPITQAVLADWFPILRTADLQACDVWLFTPLLISFSSSFFILPSSFSLFQFLPFYPSLSILPSLLLLNLPSSTPPPHPLLFTLPFPILLFSASLLIFLFFLFSFFSLSPSFSPFFFLSLSPIVVLKSCEVFGLI